VSGAAKHPAIARLQWVNMARTQKVFGARRGISQRLDGARAVIGRNARRGVAVINGHSEIGAQFGRIFGNHRVEIEAVQPFARRRHADHAAAVFQKQIDLLARDVLRRKNKIPLVFAALVVHNDDDTARAQNIKRLVDRDCFFSGFDAHRRFPQHALGRIGGAGRGRR